MGKVNKKLTKTPSLSKSPGLSLKKASTFLETKTKGEVPTPTDSVLSLERSGPDDRDEEKGAEENVHVHKQPLRMVSTTNRTIGKMKKKDRMKMRKDLLRKKLAAIDSVKKEAKEKKKREKTVIVGDMKPLVDNLAVIDDLIKDETVKEKERKEVKKAKKDSGRVKKQKQRKEQFMKDMAFLKQVYKHPDYQKDYVNTISTHIENKMLSEASKEDG